MESLNSSLRKYIRFIKEAGGWDVFQGGLTGSLDRRSETWRIYTISGNEMRFVLEIPAVSALIVGTRLTSSSSKYV